MQKKRFRIIAFAVAVITILGISAGWAMAKDVSKLIFSGVTMEAKADGSVQGFLDFKVKNIENNGVDYILEYDTNYVELSDSNNAPVPIGSGIDYAPSFLKMNNQDFSEDTFFVMSEMPVAEGKYAKVSMKIFVQEDAMGANIGQKNIGDNEVVGPIVKVIQAADKELTLGRLSFRIKDPAVFAKLSEQDLMNVFRVETNNDGSSAFAISYVDMSSYPPVVFYDDSSHLGYEFNVKNTIKSVEVNNSDRTVTAAEIYGQGNENDLIAYLNSYMQDITVTYADGTQVADTITWGDRDKGFTCDNAWDPKGGTYTVTQRYNEEFTVTAVVKVTPVSIVGYVVDNDFINYPTADDIPESLDAWKESTGEDALPKKAKPVFSVLLPGFLTYGVEIDENSWKQVLPADKDLFAAREEGQYTFTADVKEGQVPVWATVADDAAISVGVAVGAVTPEPDVEAVVDDEGLLTITVNSVGELNPLPADMNFLVRMPNGQVISHADFENGGLFEIALNSPVAGKATIKLKAGDLDNAQQRVLQQSINLGNRLGSFGIAAKSGDLPRSKWVPVAAGPRNNIYVDKNYEFDYSVTGAQIFNIASDMTAPPTTIILVGADRIFTRYSGYDGTEPGSLQTVAVESWTKVAGEMTVGSVVTFKGILKDTSYVNFGEVHNPENVQITLTLKVVESASPEKINDIDDFHFDKKRVGYTSEEVQTASFGITNLVNSDIFGLTVSLDSDDFIVVGNPDYYLATGDVTSFQIKTKEGLPVGKYSGVVTISSNKTQVLDSFRVYFEVTAGPVYRLNLSAEPQDAGTAVAPDGYTYGAGDTVTLQAEAAEDCTFAGWQVTAGPQVTFEPDAGADVVTFEMPDLENLGLEYDYITIRAVFGETDAAKLKLQNLQLFNPDDSENDLLNADYDVVQFDPKTKEYWVIAPSGAEENKATFSVNTGEGVPDMDVSASLQAGGGTIQNLTLNKHGSGSYDIEKIPLAVAPTDNLLTISLTAGGDTRSYKVHIYRKIAVKDMAQFGYGNSPYGLIMKDDVHVAPDQKDTWKAEFDKGNCFTAGYTPEGGKTGLVYYPDAWGSTQQATNYDKVDEALFVYSGESFDDPGLIDLVDSLGNEIDVNANPNSVKRKITVYKLISENHKNLMDDFRTVTAETLDLGVGNQVDVLQGLRVRPGVYAISYEFEDFDGSSVSVQRPLIVLAGRGDVDIDGSVSDADAELIANRYNMRLPYENLPGFENGSRLYQYRICDANVDRNVNIGDSNMILRYKNSIEQFYK